MDFLIQSLINSDYTLALLVLESYSLIFMQKEVFYQNLCNASVYFPARPFDGEVCMFILFVKPNNSISIMHKVYQHDILDTPRVTKMLQEYLGLFNIVAEEDIVYRQEQILIDAAILPIEEIQIQYGQRPIGISSNIPQEAIDEAIREGIDGYSNRGSVIGFTTPNIHANPQPALQHQHLNYSYHDVPIQQKPVE